jgi:hypothetical protein
MAGGVWFYAKVKVETGNSGSEELERRLIEKFGQDGLCPHGNRTNKTAAGRYKLGMQQLWKATPASLLMVDSMHKRNRRQLEYFEGLGIRPGTSMATGRPAQSKVAVP